MTTERDIRNQIRYAEKQGIEQGLERGLAQGLEQGIQRGILQGKEQKAIEIARNLLALGVDVDTIVKSSGLNEAQIEALKAV